MRKGFLREVSMGFSQDQRHTIVSALVRMADEDEEAGLDQEQVEKIRDLADLFRPRASTCSEIFPTA